MEESTESLQVGLSNVSAGLSSILLINRGDGGKAVQYATLLLDSVYEGCQGKVGAYDAIVCRPRIVLDFLYEHNVWSVQVIHDMAGHGRNVTGGRGHVLHLPDANE